MSNIEKFKTRLVKACDDSPAIPAYGKGRQIVIADHLKVSQEAVRKWFAGESEPKRDKLKKLADFLSVDEAWLSLGIRPEVDRNTQKFAGRAAEGAVLVVAGAIQLAGGNCAFPLDDDPKKGYIDIYAIVRGKKADIHVSTARETDENVFELVVPREFAEVKCVGYFPARSPMFNLVDLSPELIDKYKRMRAGDYALTITRVDGRYFTESDEWSKLKTAGGIV